MRIRMEYLFEWDKKEIESNVAESLARREMTAAAKQVEQINPTVQCVGLSVWLEDKE